MTGFGRICWSCTGRSAAPRILVRSTDEPNNNRILGATTLAPVTYKLPLRSGFRRLNFTIGQSPPQPRNLAQGRRAVHPGVNQVTANHRSRASDTGKTGYNVTRRMQ